MGRRREIADLAEFIGNQYLTPSGVDLGSIIEKNEISLSFGNYADSFDGLLELKNGQFHIYGNLDRLTTPEAPRSRFTIGHELGHFFIDEHRRGLKKSGTAHGSFVEFQSDLVIENEADLFSANLLMPATDVRNYLRNKTLGLQLCIDVSKRYSASLLSSAIRTVELSSMPAAVFKWTEDNVDWAFCSKALLATGLRRREKSQIKLIKDSATHKTYGGNSSEIEETVTTASYWFFCKNPSRNINALFREQAISLGSYGLLSFLFPLDHLQIDEQMY